MKRIIISLLLFTTISFADTPNLIINEFLASNASINLDPDFFSFCDWIEIYNSEDTVVQIGGYYITDDLSEPLKFQFPESCTIEPYSFLTIWADGKDLYPGSLHPTPLNRGNINIIGYHANFKLKKSGEEIGLFTPTGDLIHSKIFEQQITDISYGKHPNDNTQWVYYFEPSPNDSNMIIGYEDTIRSAPPQFLSDGGFYAASQAIELTSYNESAMIRFTLDGSKPNITSEVYNGPIIIDSTTVIRAQVFEDSILPSPIKTETYFINEEFTLPVISMATDPVYLWNEEIGIHVAGINGNYGCDETYSNYNQDWERPISFEYYNIDEDLGFKFNAGIKIFGGCSRGHAQKSLAIYAKNKYDTDIINYQLFNDKLINQFKSFILRNSGSDWSHSEYYPGTMLRDGMMQNLVINQMDIDYQAYQPAIIFLNGMYWGILNIREKLNGDYLESNHDVDADNVDIIKRNITVYAGDAEHFYSLLSFIESDGTTLNENYQYIKTQMEVNEYINYQISEIYFGNYDWPHNNVKYWRPKTETGKWRWILTDTDAGFSLSSSHGFSHNFLVDVSTWNGSVDCILAQNCGENDDMEIYLFKKLLENSEFQNDFINRFAFYLNTTFQPNRVINIINSLSINIEQEMQRHLAKWGDVVTITDWENNVEILREFAFERPSYVRQHIIDYFELNGTSELIIDISDLNAGRIEVHNLNILTFPDTGIYFQDIPIRIMAIPNEGYQFVNWQGNSGEISNSDTISLIISGDSTITAVFEPTVSNVDEVFIPTEYSLHQNYPNPFNPITTLRYDLPENGHVNITIYDMLGREVKSLINQSQDAGFRSVIWNATNDYGKPVSAGIYLYQIQAGEYISTKKMVLLK